MSAPRKVAVVRFKTNFSEEEIKRALAGTGVVDGEVHVYEISTEHGEPVLGLEILDFLGFEEGSDE